MPRCGPLPSLLSIHHHCRNHPRISQIAGFEPDTFEPDAFEPDANESKTGSAEVLTRTQVTSKSCIRQRVLATPVI